MPALNFPNNPSLNQIYTANNTTWQWNGSSWVRSNSGVQGVQGIQGIQGVQGVQGVIGDTYWQQTILGIHTTQNVGIATTTADSSYALDVHGDVRVSGVATFQSNVFIDGVLVAGTGGGASIGDDIVTRNLYASGVSTFFGAIEGSNATFSGDLTVGGELKYEDVVNIDSIGIVTARSGVRVTGGGLDVVGVATFNNGVDTLDVIGHAEVDQLRVSGVTTLTGNIDANGDLDVDGHTELDNVNVSGVSTFVGVGTFQNDLYVGNNLDVDGNINFNGLLFQDNSPFISSYWIQNSAGIHTLGSVGVGTTSPVGSFEVAGHTELDDVNVSGVSTFVGIVTSQSNVFVGNDLSVAGDTRIVGVLTVGSSSVTIDGDTNTINVGSGVTIHTTTSSFNQLEVVGFSTFVGVATFQNDVFTQHLSVTSLTVEGGASLGEDITTRNISASGIVTVTGTTDLNGDLDVDGHTELDNVNISGIVTSFDLDVDGHTELDNVNISGIVTSFDLDVDGHTELDNVSVSGVSTFVGVSTFQSDLFVGGTLYAPSLSITGGATLGDDLITRNISASGIITATGNIDANGDLDVDGHTELDNVNIAGVLTATSAEFSGNVTVLGDLTYENVINVDSVGIATARAGLRVTGGGLDVVGVATFNDGVNVATGNSYKINGIDIITATTLGSGVVNSSLTSVGTLTSLNVGGDLDVDGHAEFDNVNVSGIVTAALFEGSSQIGIQSGGLQIGVGITTLNFVGAGNSILVNSSDPTIIDISIAGNTGAGGTWSSYVAGIATTKSVGINTDNLDEPGLTGIGNSFKGLYISNGMIIHDNVLTGNHYIGTAFNGLMAGPVDVQGVLTIDGAWVVV